MASTRRLLVVGWDGAVWDEIHPLLDDGALPTLQRLVDSGASGALASLSPPIPPVLWTSLATGRRANRHGVTGAVELRPDRGGVQPIGQRSWRVPAFWQTLSAAGMKTAVIGWPATGPATRWPGVMIDDSFTRLGSDPPEDWPMPRQAVSPIALRQTVADLRVHPSEIDAGQLRHFIPDLSSIDPKSNPLPLRVALALAETASIHAAATYVVAEQDWDLCAIRYPLRAHHAGSSEATYRFLDMMLGRLLDLAGEATQVVVLSPGSMADGRPSEGVLVAAGSGIRPDSIVHGASVLDAGPTILAMAGIAADSDGRALSEIFTAPPALKTVAMPDLDPGVPHQPAPDLDPTAAGLIDGAAFTADVVLGEAELADGDATAAAARFEDALHRHPNDVAVLQRLALCCVRLADGARLRLVADRLAANDPDSPWTHLALGAAKAACGEAGAAAHFEQAAQRGAKDALVHLWLGEVALRIEQHAAAATHYRTALTLAPELAPAAANLGLVHLLRGEPREAERYLRRALALRYHWPAVHRRLAEALARQGREAESAAALETAAAQAGSSHTGDAGPII